MKKHFKTNKNKTKIAKIFLFGIIVLFSLQFVIAAASFQINSFSCSPSESAINSVFSCTAQIKNNGDAAGSVSTATLYPDSSNWLENSNYPQSSGTSVDPGQSTEITFAGLRSIKSGNNGFSKIMLDSVTDTYVADNNIKVNIINIIVIVDSSVSSASSGSNFDTTAEVTAGGNIDVSLTFTENSGGCNIGSQTNPKSITGMNDGNKQSRTWTVTQGTSGACSYTITAAATGSGGIASKTDSTSSIVECSDCSSGGDGTTTGGGGGGGGASTKIYTLGELIISQAVELSVNEKAKFNISGKEHTLTLTDFTETTATITIGEELTLTVGDEKEIDLDNNGLPDISIKLKSINIITNKVTLILAPTIIAGPTEKEKAPITGGAITEEGEGPGILSPSKKRFLWISIIIFTILAAISAYFAFRKKFIGR